MIDGIMLGLIGFIILYGHFKKIDLYDSFINGTKEGLKLFQTLFPSLLGLMLAIQLLQSSGSFTILSNIVSFLFKSFSLPIELVGMILLRPMSGSGSLAFLNQIYSVYGTEALVSKMATLIQGATDTTLYVISLYFGHIQLKKTGYSVYLCLFLDGVAIALAIFLATNFFH